MKRYTRACLTLVLLISATAWPDQNAAVYKAEIPQVLVPPISAYLVLGSNPTLLTFQPMKGQIVADSPDALRWESDHVLIGANEKIERVDDHWILSYRRFSKRKIPMTVLPNGAEEIASLRRRAHVDIPRP